MPNLSVEIENCRKRWYKAKKEDDRVLMDLWERVGQSLKKIINYKGDKNFKLAKKIFNGEKASTGQTSFQD